MGTGSVVKNKDAFNVLMPSHIHSRGCSPAPVTLETTQARGDPAANLQWFSRTRGLFLDGLQLSVRAGHILALALALGVQVQKQRGSGG